MRKLTVLISAVGIAATSGYGVVPAPALAQAQPNVAEIIVYGSDPCPRSTDDEVVVCSRRPEAERYRIAPKLRPSGTRQQTESWAQRAKNLETVGRTGINSCSPVGPAGYTGCLTQVINQARQEQREQSQSNTPPEQ